MRIPHIILAGGVRLFATLGWISMLSLSLTPASAWEPPAAASHASPTWKLYPEHLELKQGGTWQTMLAYRTDERGRVSDHTTSLQFTSRHPEILAFDQGTWMTRSEGTTAVDVVDAEGRQIGSISVTIAPEEQDPLPPSFVDDILPILTKTGCNNGACHAKPGGRNAFELSVFGDDPAADYQEIVEDARGRRVFPSSPEQSLLLMKPTLQVPHEGNAALDKESAFYQTIVRWIADGMRFRHETAPSLSHIEVVPHGGRLDHDRSLQLGVWAHYSDGSLRDITHLAEFQSTDKDLIQISHDGLAQTLNREGQAVIVTRFSGKIAESQWIIPRSETPTNAVAFWESLPEHNLIDRYAHAYLKQLGYTPSALCSDETFIRRAFLDAAGVLPSPEATRTFLEDPRPDKRSHLIRELMEHRWIGDYWANKWTDLLRPNPDRAGIKSVFMFDQWVRDCFRNNMPYDDFVRAILTLEGSNHQMGPAAIYRDKRTPEDRTVLFSQVFLGVRLECAKCHHHPFEKWGQDDFYRTAAFFGAVGQKGAGVSPPISAGTETFFFRPGGKVRHPKTEEVMQPVPPGETTLDWEAASDPRHAWMDWMLDPENPYFAQAAVNRVWSVFFGRGFVHPVDDFRTSNPPVHAPLLQALSEEFIRQEYDLRKLMTLIMESRLYQLSSIPNTSNVSDTQYFSRYYRKRLPAEVLMDAVADVTGIHDSLEGLPAGSRAMEAWNFKIDSQFMDAFDRPNSSSDPPCERVNQPSVVQSLHMMHAENIQSKLESKDGWVASLMQGGLDKDGLVDEVYLKLYSRYPDAEERKIAVSALLGEDLRDGLEDLVWALLNSAEFIFNH